jgi:hypothetical protein
MDVEKFVVAWTEPCACVSCSRLAVVGSSSARVPQRAMSDSRDALVLHLVVRVDKVLVIVLLVLVAELLVGLGEVDVLAAGAGSNDVGCVNLLHVVLIWLLDCSNVKSTSQERVIAGYTFTCLGSC